MRSAKEIARLRALHAPNVVEECQQAEARDRDQHSCDDRGPPGQRCKREEQQRNAEREAAAEQDEARHGKDLDEAPDELLLVPRVLRHGLQEDVELEEVSAERVKCAQSNLHAREHLRRREKMQAARRGRTAAKLARQLTNMSTV